MTGTAQRCDAVIMGGGLAGLTLALQLKQRFQDIDVLVLERRKHPVPHAAHKVGESSVEIGAHYFDTVLGLQPHMDGAQLRKFGFRFFFSEGRRDIDQVTEIGASRYLAVPSYQIDRGIFENYLAQEAVRRGVRFDDAALVRRVDLAPDAGDAGDAAAPHRVEWSRGGETHSAEARWLIDACGRAGLLKRKLGLAEANAHDVNAVWFRIAERIAIDDWSDNASWQDRCDPRARWLSTNHLVGAGYWAWLIPLASGSHSVGIVADPKLHPLDTIDTFEKAMQWFATYQPRLYDALDGKRHLLQDFAFLKHFSHGCKQVFSGRRWALTGEAGLFLDPFYSPGSDFIAMSNTYIADLVAHDRAGRSLEARAQLYDQIYHSFYESTLALYQDQYPLFGDPEVLPVKVIWDYAYYWGVLAQIFFQQRLTDLMLLGSLKEELQHCQRLNLAVQQLLRAWSAASARRNAAVMLDQAAMPWFAELNRSLKDPRQGDAGFKARIRASASQLRQLAREILERARADNADLSGCSLPSILEEILALPPASVPGGAMLFAAIPDDSRKPHLPNFTERSSPVASRGRP
jgi:flavin-dependent dehydrogenase